jgi:DNA invertase Pin-like site-specific DNA recombinase
MFHVFGALSEFERNLIKERTLAGLENALARGGQGGRPEKLNDEQQELVIKKVYRPVVLNIWKIPMLKNQKKN